MKTAVGSKIGNKNRMRKVPGLPAVLSHATDPARKPGYKKSAARGYTIKPQDLSSLHVFRNVILEEVWDLIKKSPAHLLEKGDILIDKGKSNAAPVLYLIVHGRLSVTLDAPGEKRSHSSNPARR